MTALPKDLEIVVELRDSYSRRLRDPPLKSIQIAGTHLSNNKRADSTACRARLIRQIWKKFLLIVGQEFDTQLDPNEDELYWVEYPVARSNKKRFVSITDQHSFINAVQTTILRSAQPTPDAPPNCLHVYMFKSGTANGVGGSEPPRTVTQRQGEDIIQEPPGGMSGATPPASLPSSSRPLPTLGNHFPQLDNTSILELADVCERAQAAQTLLSLSASDRGFDTQQPNA